jgi:hypothetical protein
MDIDGPFLQTAVICERVLQEADGVISAIRIIDRVTFVLGPDGEPVQPQHPIFILVSFKSGVAQGSHQVTIQRCDPDGTNAQVLTASPFFEGLDRGINMVIGAAFAPSAAGLYWYDVYFEDERITRIPLRAVYQPLPTAGG